MARMRSMKPEYFKDQDLAEDLPGPEGRDARLMYPGLWCLADEHGRLRGDARSIKGELFAYDDDMTPEAIDRLIDLLEVSGRAVRYREGKSVYLYLPKLAPHQRLEPHKVPSRLPAPPSELLGQSKEDSSENFPDESAPLANVYALRQAACSKEHEAGSKTESRGEIPRGAEQAGQLVIDAAGVDATVAAEVVLAIARERRPTNLPGLVQRIIRDRELSGWIAKAHASLAAISNPDSARASPGECPHGNPGGLELIGSTGKPRCPQCRREYQRGQPA